MGYGFERKSFFHAFRSAGRLVCLACIAMQFQPDSYSRVLAEGPLTSMVAAVAFEHPPQASDTTPGKAESLLLRGRGDLRAGRVGEAEKAFEQVLSLVPNSARFHAAILDSYSGTKYLSSAKELFEWKSQKAPDNPLYLVDLVQVGLLSGDIALVMHCLTTTARKFARDGKLHAQLGKILFERSQEDLDYLALAEFLRAQQSGYRDFEVSLSLASLESTTGAFSDAIQNALWVEKQPGVQQDGRAAAAEVAGEGFASEGEASKAIEQLKTAVELAPDVEDYYLGLARVYVSRRDYKGAVDVLEQGRQHIPDSADILLDLGTDLAAAADFSGAVTVLEESVTRFPDRFPAYVQLADSYRMEGDLKRASQVLHRLAVLQPQFPMIHVMLARALHEAGATYDAIFDELDKAEKTSPSDPYVYYLRGKTYMEMQRYQEAVKALSRAIQLQPATSDYHYQLGLAYLQLGKQAMAQEQFDEKAYLDQQEEFNMKNNLDQNRPSP